MPERIVVGMSGGVDSSVAAAILVEQGYDVVGVTLRVWPWRESQPGVDRFGSCCSPEAADDARRVARQLGIPYYLLDSEREFGRTVIDRFAESYAAGRTPVPCVACNRDVKFGSLLGRARAWGASAVATGHYARITRDEATGRHLLWRGRDRRRDQSDFLWPLDQQQLGAARFPVGDLDKSDVRRRARALGLVTADKPESQDICFIPDNDYRGFLKRRAPAVLREGPILDMAGRVVGRHEGIANYTVGQRRGLGVTGPRPLYVTALDPERNAVVVGEAVDVEVDRIWADDVNLIAVESIAGPRRVEARLRKSQVR
jgi:tRNA-specific 2-thiouridylase